MKIVVGLGNPGPKYVKTRHNVGYRVVAELAARHHGRKPQHAHEADIVDISIDGQKTLLVAPTTYMNNSGRSVRKIIDYFSVPLADLLVVSDDMNLEPARLRLRPGGSAGGQKGMQDVIDRLGTEDFARLRIGIGRPPAQMDSTDYVLSRFKRDEVASIDAAVQIAADGIELWIAQGLAAAMNAVNAPDAK